MTAVTASIDIAVPPRRVWDVIMDPYHFDEWVTIHRRLHHVDEGKLAPGFRVEQTLCLHRANFNVKWALAEMARRTTPSGRGVDRPARTRGSSTR